MAWPRSISLTLVTALAPMMSGCIVSVVDDMAEDGDTSSGNTTSSSATTTTSSTSATTTSSTSAEGGTNSGGDGDGTPGDGDGAGDGDGDPPCGPYPTTEVMECPQIIGEGFCSEGGGHVDIGTEIMWMHEPPHSGKHFPIWSSWGEKVDPVERGYWVHNIEHGGIVIIYNCPDPGMNGCKDDLDVLRAAMLARPDHKILLTPDPLLQGSTYAAITWTWVHAFNTPVLEDVLCFIDQHYDHAPESVL